MEDIQLCSKCGDHPALIVISTRKRLGGTTYKYMICEFCNVGRKKKMNAYNKEYRTKQRRAISLPVYNLPKGYLKLAKETELRIARKYA